MDSRRSCSCGEQLYGDAWKTHKCISKTEEVTTDMVNHPPHYKQHPSGVECITVTEHFNFNVGNAIKYLWRSDHKNGLEDLKKAAWYVNREIERLNPREKTKDVFYSPKVGDAIQFRIINTIYFETVTIVYPDDSFCTNTTYSRPTTLSSIINFNRLVLQWLSVRRYDEKILEWRIGFGFVPGLLCNKIKA